MQSDVESANSAGDRESIHETVEIQRVLLAEEKRLGEHLTHRQKLTHKQELHALRILYMHDMTDTVTIETAGGVRERKKVLFLRSEDAFSFRASDVSKLLVAMELADHKMIIRIPRSMCGFSCDATMLKLQVWEECTRVFDELAESGQSSGCSLDSLQTELLKNESFNKFDNTDAIFEEFKNSVSPLAQLPSCIRCAPRHT